MRRREYRLTVSWPYRGPTFGVPHVYGKHYASKTAALKAAASYRADGATVTAEVWGHAGEDRNAGWYRDAKATAEFSRIVGGK